VNLLRRTAVAKPADIAQLPNLSEPHKRAIMQTVLSSVNAVLVVLAADFEGSAPGGLIRRGFFGLGATRRRSCFESCTC
jgi:hypothetical protein